MKTQTPHWKPAGNGRCKCAVCKRHRQFITDKNTLRFSPSLSKKSELAEKRLLAFLDWAEQQDELLTLEKLSSDEHRDEFKSMRTRLAVATKTLKQISFAPLACSPTGRKLNA